jgi:hypothetical protein
MFPFEAYVIRVPIVNRLLKGKVSIHVITVEVPRALACFVLGVQFVLGTRCHDVVRVANS